MTSPPPSSDAETTAAPGTRLRDEVNDLLRAGLASASRHEAEPEAYVLPTYDPGRALITDYRELAQMLDDEDVTACYERGRDPGRREPPR